MKKGKKKIILVEFKKLEKNNKCIDEFSLIHYTNNSVVFLRIFYTN